MNRRILFREYNGILNTVSGTAGDATLTGSGTSFTEVAVGTPIEVDDIGFVGYVASVTDDTHLELDRLQQESFSGKIWWQDWTVFLIEIGEISRKVESDIEGEAGVIMYDNVDARFYFGANVTMAGTARNNPVLSAFSADLDAKNRYLLKIEAVKYDFAESPASMIGSSYDRVVTNLSNEIAGNWRQAVRKKIFEGMVDFSTIEYPVYPDGSGEYINEISFTLLDKLSAIEQLNLGSLQRGEQMDVADLLGATEEDPVSFEFIAETIAGIGTVNVMRNYGLVWVTDHYEKGTIIEHTEPVLKIGETFLYFNIKTDIVLDEPFIVVDSGLCVHGGVNTTWVKVALAKDITYSSDVYFFTHLPFYAATYYAETDIGIYETVSSRDVLKGFDGTLMLSGIIKEVWSNNVLAAADVFKIPLNYFKQMLDERPLGKSLYEAMKYLGQTMNAYVYYAKDGKLVIIRKTDIQARDESGDTELDMSIISNMNKRHFWDKLIDSAEVEITGWYYTTEFLKGKGAAYLNDKVEPRNKLSRSTFINTDKLDTYGWTIDSSTGELSDGLAHTQQQLLDWYATNDAEEYLNFYGKRRDAYTVEFCDITWEMLDLEMTDIIAYNGGRYFITQMGIDLEQNSMSLEMVNLSSATYNNKNVLIPKSIVKSFS
jgi:hypothetical protein